MYRLVRPAVPGRAATPIQCPTERVNVCIIDGEYHAECRTREGREVLMRLHGYKPAPDAPKAVAKPARKRSKKKAAK